MSIILDQTVLHYTPSYQAIRNAALLVFLSCNINGLCHTNRIKYSKAELAVFMTNRKMESDFESIDRPGE